MTQAAAPVPARRHPLPAGRAICYSGYRPGQSPDLQRYPSEAEIEEDLRLLAPHFALLRLYDASPHAERVLQVLARTGLPLRVLLGAWLAAETDNPGCPWGGGVHGARQLAVNRQRNDDEVARAIALAQAHPGRVVALAVGNEAAVDWTDHRVPVARIAEQVERVRAAVALPVTVCDNHVPWRHALAPLAARVDFLSLHTYPVWEGRTAAEALAHAQADVARVAAAHPGVPVAITEAGWATQANGRGFPAAHAGEDAQAQHLHELLAWSEAAGIPCFVFEAFDEPWKGADDLLEPEKHWGLFTAARQPKRWMREALAGGR